MMWENRALMNELALVESDIHSLHSSAPTAMGTFIFIVSSACFRAEKETAPSTTTYYGLWKLCMARISASIACSDMDDFCSQYGSSCSKMRAARAFMTLATITSFVTFIFMIITAIMNQFRSVWGLISTGLVWFSALCGLIGMAVGIDLLLEETIFVWELLLLSLLLVLL